MLLSPPKKKLNKNKNREKKNKTNKQQQNKQKQQQHIISPAYITGGYSIRQWL